MAVNISEDNTKASGKIQSAEDNIGSDTDAVLQNLVDAMRDIVSRLEVIEKKST